MKKITSILSVMALTAVFSTNVIAQQSASGTAPATAQIITPISILKTVDLNFGVFSTDGTLGTILLTAAATPTVTASSGITRTTKTTAAAAAFTVSGDTDYTYSIELPGTVTLTGAVLTNTMTIDKWTSSLTSLTGGVLVDGKQTVYIGGTLNVPTGAKKDTYTNTADLTVVVNYN